jgi:NADPH:quinone reductase-like Zn-dependent oxidoreductase
MRAIAQRRYGDAPEEVLRLQEAGQPAIGDEEVLVRVRAAGVDRGTRYLMSGAPYVIRLAGTGLLRPKHLNPARDLAGTVAAAGAKVTGFEPGDEVFGVGVATFAEYALATPGKLAPKPANVSFEQAAAVPISGLTALQAVRDHGNIRTGQRVLVIGASGGVGSFAVQLAKACGAEVTGVCSAAKVEAVRSFGADRVIDYTTGGADDFARTGDRYDVILDIGGSRSLTLLRRMLTPAGTLVLVGAEFDGKWIAGTDRLLRARALAPVASQRIVNFVTRENAADLLVLRDLIESGKVIPAVDRVFPLAESAAAVRYMLDGRAAGKVVVSI